MHWTYRLAESQIKYGNTSHTEIEPRQVRKKVKAFTNKEIERDWYDEAIDVPPLRFFEAQDDLTRKQNDGNRECSGNDC